MGPQKTDQLHLAGWTLNHPDPETSVQVSQHSPAPPTSDASSAQKMGR